MTPSKQQKLLALVIVVMVLMSYAVLAESFAVPPALRGRQVDVMQGEDNQIYYHPMNAINEFQVFDSNGNPVGIYIGGEIQLIGSKNIIIIKEVEPVLIGPDTNSLTFGQRQPVTYSLAVDQSPLTLAQLASPTPPSQLPVPPPPPPAPTLTDNTLSFTDSSGNPITFTERSDGFWVSSADTPANPQALNVHLNNVFGPKAANVHAFQTAGLYGDLGRDALDDPQLANLLLYTKDVLPIQRTVAAFNTQANLINQYDAATGRLNDLIKQPTDIVQLLIAGAQRTGKINTELAQMLADGAITQEQYDTSGERRRVGVDRLNNLLRIIARDKAGAEKKSQNIKKTLGKTIQQADRTFQRQERIVQNTYDNTIRTIDRDTDNQINSLNDNIQTLTNNLIKGFDNKEQNTLKKTFDPIKDAQKISDFSLDLDNLGDRAGDFFRSPGVSRTIRRLQEDPSTEIDQETGNIIVRLLGLNDIDQDQTNAIKTNEDINKANDDITNLNKQRAAQIADADIVRTNTISTARNRRNAIILAAGGIPPKTPLATAQARSAAVLDDIKARINRLTIETAKDKTWDTSFWRGTYDPIAKKWLSPQEAGENRQNYVIELNNLKIAQTFQTKNREFLNSIDSKTLAALKDATLVRFGDRVEVEGKTYTVRRNQDGKLIIGDFTPERSEQEFPKIQAKNMEEFSNVIAKANIDITSRTVGDKVIPETMSVTSLSIDGKETTQTLYIQTDKDGEIVGVFFDNDLKKPAPAPFLTAALLDKRIKELQDIKIEDRTEKEKAKLKELEERQKKLATGAKRGEEKRQQVLANQLAIKRATELVTALTSKLLGEFLGDIVSESVIEYCEKKVGASDPEEETPTSINAPPYGGATGTPTPGAQPQAPVTPTCATPSAVAQVIISNTQAPYQYDYNYAVLACDANIQFRVVLKTASVEVELASGTALANQAPASETDTASSNTLFDEICIETSSQIGNPCFPGVGP